MTADNNNNRKENPYWQQLLVEKQRISRLHLRELFAADPDRSSRYSLCLDELLVDYSRHLLDSRVLEMLHGLARACDLRARIEDLFSGAQVNDSENRAAMHWLLRCPADCDRPERAAELAQVHGQLEQMRDFVQRLQAGDINGASGKKITRLVNIGIGGSDLGPRLAHDALSAFRQGDLEIDFVSNLDPKEMAAVLARSDPATVMFIIVSKTFTTLETMANAETALRWLEDGGCPSPRQQLLAVTSNREAALQFGIPGTQVFEFWDWVGGRYSLWSTVGLSVAAAIGMTQFEEMLAGAHQVDVHFEYAEPEENIPLVLALLDIWYNNFFEAETHAVIPYDHSLQMLPEYLSQLIMESNGKSTSQSGQMLDLVTTPVFWGAAGTNAQHAFFQMLHQGTHLVPVDFLLPMKSHINQAQQLKQVSNCLAQSEALMLGEDNPQDLHRRFPGNSPSSTIVYNELTPHTLGMLLAIYEHRTFVQAMIWDINPFDQFGVELGKKLARTLISELQDKDGGDKNHDSATALLMREYWRRNEI